MALKSFLSYRMLSQVGKRKKHFHILFSKMKEKNTFSYNNNIIADYYFGSVTILHFNIYFNIHSECNVSNSVSGFSALFGNRLGNFILGRDESSVNVV
jgi:hypothetical protein